MKEQTGSYIVHYASIHLAAIRYMMLYSLMLDDGRLKFGEIRNKISGAIEQLGFIALLWEFFKAILHGVLESFSKTLGKKTLIKIENAFQASIEEFLFCALQMDNQSVRAQIKAEKLGVDLGEPCNV